jgi:hypothetical protein
MARVPTLLHRSPTERGRLALGLVPLLSLATSLGCKDDAGSGLRDRSQPVTPASHGTKATPAPASSDPAPSPTADYTPPTDPDAFVTLRFAMPDGEAYSVTTVAMVELPMVNRPVGWAREERFEFENCTGEGVDRSCTLRHEYVAFEGQPPTGPLLEADELKVRNVTSRHEITAAGFREGETRLELSEGEIEPDLRESLASIHRLYCIRFPKEPVAVGAKWNDTCQTFDRGVAVTRNLLWELSELSDDPEGGKRAELRGIGEYVVPGSDGERKGTVEMILYFFVEAGEPHLLRERRTIPVSEERGAHTKETVNIQFAKMLEGDRERLVRTDGRPFPTPEPQDEAAEVPPEASGPR